MTYAEEDYLQLSGIQHFSFCRRQWALIHIEKLWDDNLRTVEGTLMHKRAHDAFFTEKRRDVIITREMPVFSRVMGVSGKCDVLELHRDEDDGVVIFGRAGKWTPCPVEYKRGKPKTIDADRLQLCAQAMCLEEMLACRKIELGYLYYGETRKREPVALDDDLRASVSAMFKEMHGYFERRHTPRVKPTKSCSACSLKDMCLPRLPSAERSVSIYISESLSKTQEASGG
jgi:CRISPR-associated exonuclease Cas4